MNTLVKNCFVSAATFAVLLFTSCSESTKPAATDTTTANTEAAKPAEPVSAKTAFWPMYTAARQWSTDFVLLSVKPKEVTGVKNEGGKAAVWEATFASPSQHAYRVYTEAIAAYPPDVYKGVTVGRALPWAGSTRDVMPIQTSDFQVDSDAAYQTAAADAAPWLKKNADKPLTTFELGNAYKFPVPVWYVVWGTKKAGYSVIVNAATGKVLKSK
jgi:hypothetical protein